MFSARLPAPRLRDDGPRIRVRVGSTSADSGRRVAEGTTTLPTIEAVALIDTGSGRTILQAGLPAELHLPSVGSVEIDTPAAVDFPASEFEAQIWFDPETAIEVRVLEAPLQVPQVRVLIGRDILAFGRLVYDGVRHEVVLELPRGTSRPGTVRARQ